MYKLLECLSYVASDMATEVSLKDKELEKLGNFS